jgi:polar amino acid transport system substrate-binding protein
MRALMRWVLGQRKRAKRYCGEMRRTKRSWIRIMGLVFALSVSGAHGEDSVPSKAIESQPLRVAINHGNAVLAKLDPINGQLSGVSVDMALELGRRWGMKVKLIGFDAANKSVQALRRNAVDVGFFAIDPQRSQGLLFTAPYVVIEGAYVVPQDSRIQALDDVDRPQIRVAVAEKSAYDLYLTRALQNAQLVKTARSSDVVDLMLTQRLEVAAGVRQQLEKDMQKHAQLRMLTPAFMQIQQAMATSEARSDLHLPLQHFVEEMKASGFVLKAMQRHQIEGAQVAPSVSLQ